MSISLCFCYWLVSISAYFNLLHANVAHGTCNPLLLWCDIMGTTNVYSRGQHPPQLWIFEQCGGRRTNVCSRQYLNVVYNCCCFKELD